MIEKEGLLVGRVRLDVGKEDIVGCDSRYGAEFGGSCRRDSEEKEAVVREKVVLEFGEEDGEEAHIKRIIAPDEPRRV